jgi:hypothetical protein
MRILVVVACALMGGQYSYAQYEVDQLLTEGRKLYYSEKAAWHGTDIFVSQLPEKMDAAGGYFTYQEEQAIRCLFYSNDERPRVIATITFDSTFTMERVQVSTDQREFTPAEQQLYLLRKQALEVIDTDTLFTSYTNTSFNLIPIIDSHSRKVYVLTGPQAEGVVILGNDYLIEFNEANQLIHKKKLHKNIIPIHYSTDGKQLDKSAFGSMHSHLPETGDYITATDICTLLLYGKFTGWKQHTVISANYVSIWDFSTEQLSILPRDTWENMGKPPKKNKRSKP